MNIFEFSGILGFIGYIVTYALLQTGIISSDQMKYSTLNLLSATLVLIGLTDTFNPAAASIQVCWILISLWGVGRVALMHKQSFSRKRRRKRRSYAKASWVV